MAGSPENVRAEGGGESRQVLCLPASGRPVLPAGSG